MPAIAVGVVGPGLVGKALLEQLEAHGRNYGGNALVRVAGVINSSKMLLLKEDNWVSELAKWPNEASAASMDEFVKHMEKQGKGAAIADCTSSDGVAAQYPAWMDKGISIVTPNKKGFSGDRALFDTIIGKRAGGKAYAYHEATVGAGLPIISTLNYLTRTGDEIVRIEGIFSGTMSFLFNTFSTPTGPSAMPFSKCVLDAKDKGYTEPDPRDDLNGMQVRGYRIYISSEESAGQSTADWMDVARKVVILGRVAGLNVSLDSLVVENVVPTELQSVATADEFMARLPEFDAHFAELNAAAAARQEVLRYVGVVDPSGKSAAQLKSYPYSHPFASLKGSDNIIAFTTKRYPNPLIVQGAGAGAAVTASGIFNDLLTIADRVL